MLPRGTFLDHLANADMAIFDSAVRPDGASHGYASPKYPAAASFEMIRATVDAAQSLGLTYRASERRGCHLRPGSSSYDF
jgi:uridine phosphorylase